MWVQTTGVQETLSHSFKPLLVRRHPCGFQPLHLYFPHTAHVDKNEPNCTSEFHFIICRCYPKAQPTSLFPESLTVYWQMVTTGLQCRSQSMLDLSSKPGKPSFLFPRRQVPFPVILVYSAYGTLSIPKGTPRLYSSQEVLCHRDSIKAWGWILMQN